MGHVLLKRALLPALLLAAVACETTKSSRRPPAEKGSGRWLYEQNCDRCHALYMPASFDAAEWKYYVKKYGRKSRLNKDQRAKVYAYLAANARR